MDLGSMLSRCPRLRVLSVTIYPDQDRYALHIGLPPAGCEFPALEKLTLYGKIAGLGSLLGRCQRLRVLSVTQLDLGAIPPPSGEFPALERLTLSGSIADLGTWLNRCPRLHVLGVTFGRMRLPSLKEALATLEEAAAPLGLVLSILGISIPWRDDTGGASFASLLSTAARLSPRELAVTDDLGGCDYSSTRDKQIKAILPCFAHAKSIKMNLWYVFFTSLWTATGVLTFSALETLHLWGLSSVADIGTLVTRCPRLRVLEVTAATGKLTVRSASLQKLEVKRNCGTECHGIDILTPMLEELHLEVRARRDFGVSIWAPMLKNVSWHRWYKGSAHVFGSWYLQSLTVQTMIESSYGTKSEGTGCSMQLPASHTLCLRLNADNQLDADQLNFAPEMEKLRITNFSVLEIIFGTSCHVYGAFVLRLLRMPHICAATKKLKVVLPWCWRKVKQVCLQNCPCDKDKNWRRQRIFCTSLEEVEICGFNREDHEHDFLRLILKCSPMLKSVILRPLQNVVEGCTTELSNIFSAHPSVTFYE